MFGDMLQNLESQVLTAIEDTNKDMTRELRRYAFAAWGYDRIGRSLSFMLSTKYENGHFVPDYPEQFVRVVQDREYGVTQEDPNPVLRRFLNRSDQMASTLFMQHLTGRKKEEH